MTGPDLAAPGVSAQSAEPTYSELELYQSRGAFAGQVRVTNQFNQDIEVFVEVNVYDGDQEVGELHGDVTLKPQSAAQVELYGLDEFASYSEARVSLNGYPVGLATGS